VRDLLPDGASTCLTWASSRSRPAAALLQGVHLRVPYGARYVHPKAMSTSAVCDHRIKEGKDPACVSVCRRTACISATWTIEEHRRVPAAHASGTAAAEPERGRGSST